MKHIKMKSGYHSANFRTGQWRMQLPEIQRLNMLLNQHWRELQHHSEIDLCNKGIAIKWLPLKNNGLRFEAVILQASNQTHARLRRRTQDIFFSQVSQLIEFPIIQI